MREIIDTHLHTWDLNTFSYYWLNDDSSVLAQSYFVEQLRPQMAAAGVGSAVLVQATNSLTESDWLLELAAKHSWIKGAVIWLPLQKPDVMAAALEKYRDNPWFKGVRHQIHDEEDEKWLLQPSVLESLSLLAAEQIPYDLVGTKTVHIETAIQVAAKVPDLKMVFDHLNQPPIANRERFGKWGTLMETAADHPNFYAKISGLGATCAKGHTWTSDDIKPYIAHCIRLFGSNRLFCGGDWPVSVLSGTYAYTWQQYQKALGELMDARSQEKLYHDNACRFYKLKT